MNMASSVEARLKEREEARRAAVQQRKAERAIGGRPEEAAGYFSQQFAAKKAGECVNKIWIVTSSRHVHAMTSVNRMYISYMYMYPSI